MFELFSSFVRYELFGQKKRKEKLCIILWFAPISGLWFIFILNLEQKWEESNGKVNRWAKWKRNAFNVTHISDVLVCLASINCGSWSTTVSIANFSIISNSSSIFAIEMLMIKSFDDLPGSHNTRKKNTAMRKKKTVFYSNDRGEIQIYGNAVAQRQVHLLAFDIIIIFLYFMFGRLLPIQRQR